MSEAQPTLSDVLNNILNAIVNVLNAVATTIASNASLVATLIVVGGLAVVVMKYGSKIFRNLSGLFRMFG